jgi:hypothetical protein
MEQGLNSPRRGETRRRIEVVFLSENQQPTHSSATKWLESQRPQVEDSEARAEHWERSIKRKIFG